jgi:putative transposase
MPEHVHLLVYPTTTQPRLDQYLASFKQPFSSEIKEILYLHRSSLLEKLTVRERPGKNCFRYWQEGGGYDRNLHTPRSIQASLEYMHLNPVRRGLCESAIDWKWSSARYYLCDPRVDDPDLPKIHGLPVGALD